MAENADFKQKVASAKLRELCLLKGLLYETKYDGEGEGAGVILPEKWTPKKLTQIRVKPY